MRYLIKQKKYTAIAMLIIFSINLFAPAMSYALTSGPAQPETKGFQPAGVSDMVDLQTGSLKYNIPLVDIDGYPLNLNYQSGSGLEDEASWVGLGWSLNPGAINRQVRGLPDDFLGDDVETDHFTRPKVTVGGRITAKFEFLGKAAQGSFTAGIFSDNYTGIGAELGVNAGISYSFANSSLLTAGMGAGVLSNTQSGVDASVSPYVSLAVKENADNKITNSAGFSGTLGYNTRSGLKSLSLGTTFSTPTNSLSLFGTNISYNTEPISPTIQIPYKSTYGSFSLDVGGEVWGSFPSGGGTGYQNVREVKSFVNKRRGYGFLYAERGKNDPDALMDFIREKDNPIIPTIPNLAIPIHMPDMWSYTSQTGSGQFKLYRGGSGAFFDNKTEDESKISTSGGDIGPGGWFHGGLTHYEQDAKTTTRKWVNNNNYLAKGDFQNESYSSANSQHVYFKKIGETNLEDQEIASQTSGTQALAVNTSGVTANASFVSAGGKFNMPQLVKTKRRQNSTAISYLTAEQAKVAGLNQKIKYYPFYNPAATYSFLSNPEPTASGITRDAGYRKKNHISEVTVTDEGGKRMVYGIPVYNTKQEEYTFAVGTANGQLNGNKNQVATPSILASNPQGNTLGTDYYYHKESKGAYATSYLLSGILSADYVDKTGDGITDDDLGTAIKFNYSKMATPDYRWRSPYQNAMLNKSLLADPDDDKGSIVYGEKELWFISSIESKTKIAYFVTEDRRDALGVTGWQNGGKDVTQTQKRLREIRLYSKADMTRPIKVVKFAYTYELCKGQTGAFLPNSADAGAPEAVNGGKLTLSKVWFEYGNSNKGANHAYAFKYRQGLATTPDDTMPSPSYRDLSTDRWGNFKAWTELTNGLDNSMFPYTNQNKAITDKNVGLWQLSTIDLPTGGKITISYESGDYAYVQDKKAMVMTGFTTLINAAGAGVSKLNDATGIQMDIGPGLAVPATNQLAWFKNTFLNGTDYLYTKFYVKLSTPNSRTADMYDYVPCYAKVSAVSITGTTAKITFVTVDESGLHVNPICIASWQKLKNEYPRFAYPGFDNRIKSGNNSFSAAVSAIVNAAKNLSELKRNFYQKANSKNYGTTVDVAKSFVKIVKTDGFKLGGSVRVKKIQIDDNWQGLSNNSNATAGSYGQAYTYTTTDNGKTISSGVATYEPAVGNDENPLKQPVMYSEKVKGGISNYFSIELPFCESLYPAPSIGYSKVTVNDLDRNHTASNLTGTVVSEFYTAKDFPVKVTVLPIINQPGRKSNSYALMKSNNIEELSLSQGYSIELNDMHGKPKSNTVYNQGGAEISSTAYYYFSTDNGGLQTLNNNVNVINNSDLKLTSKYLGRDIEFFTDMREQEAINKGRAVNIGGDLINAFWPLLWLHKPINGNDDYKLFRSACALKVVQSYGILSKVVKRQNGSSITTQNLAFDELTGQVVVTKTQNEFKKDIYSINIPAYWAYKGMGGAYQNLGTMFKGMVTDVNGEILNYGSFLQAGDEIVDLSTIGFGQHYWVIENQAAAGGTTTTKKLINRDGTMAKSHPFLLVKIIRSGYRNMLSDNATTLVCLEKPFDNTNTLKLVSSGDLSAMKVINASASVYDENWAPGNICAIKQIPIRLVDTTNLVESTTRDFSVTGRSYFTAFITRITKLGTTSDSTINISSSPYWGGGGIQGRAGVVSFWPTAAATIDSTNINNAWFCFQKVIDFPESKIYYFASTYTNEIYIGVDCNGNAGSGGNRGTDINSVYVTAGKHLIKVGIKMFNSPVAYANRAAGIEIYNNTFTELKNADSFGTGLKRLFSTKNFAGNNNVLSYFSYLALNENQDTKYHFTNADGTPPFYNTIYGCPPGALQNSTIVVNPYTTGLLGNWRPYQTKVFQNTRNYAFAGNLSQSGVNVKNAGYLNNFTPFWSYNTASTSWVPNTTSTNWVTANTVTLYDKYGQQLENKDALGRYSAAKFDFNGELPSAVASNARNREIYTATLEDSKFTVGSTGNTDTCNVREFVRPSNKTTIKQQAINTLSHSGNYSVQLQTDGLTLATVTHNVNHKTIPYYKLDASKQYSSRDSTGLYPNGFEPSPGKKYIFNAWVQDTHPADNVLGLTLATNGTNVPLTCKANVEGWKLVEGVIDLTSIGSTALNISIVPVAGQSPYIDDIRIHPVDAHMKTYAYDDKTMRLMAEIDENGFATFYEYDDEGLLIRVKKETEKGIMTIKESRSSYKKGI